MAVLRGERLEVGDYRAFDGPGLNSKIFIDRSPKREQIEQDRAEDETWAAYVERRNEMLRERGRTPKEPRPQDWLPKGQRT